MGSSRPAFNRRQPRDCEIEKRRRDEIRSMRVVRADQQLMQIKNYRRRSLARTSCRAAATLLAALAFSVATARADDGAPSAATAPAQQATAAQGAPSQFSSALLSQINRESTALYGAVRPSIVRVQLPIPQWVQLASRSEVPNQRYATRPDPDLLRQLQRQFARVPGGGFIVVHEVMPTTSPDPRTAPDQGSAGPGGASPSGPGAGNPGSRAIKTLAPTAGFCRNPRWR